MTMQAAMAERTLPDIFYEDPEPIEDGMRQELTISLLIVMLRQWFRCKNVFVSGSGFIFWNPINGNDRVAPDGYIALETDPGFVYQFPNYLIWEVGKPPDLVMEVASESTSDNDLGPKRDLYARSGVFEYWKFDPTRDKLYGTPLLGERLVNGEYVPYDLNVEPDGSVWSYSEVLGLEFWWDGDGFDIRDSLTGYSINTAVTAERERTRAQHAEERAGYAEFERIVEQTCAERAEERAERAAERERQSRLELEARLREMFENGEKE